MRSKKASIFLVMLMLFSLVLSGCARKENEENNKEGQSNIKELQEFNVLLDWYPMQYTHSYMRQKIKDILKKRD